MSIQINDLFLIADFAWKLALGGCYAILGTQLSGAVWPTDIKLNVRESCKALFNDINIYLLQGPSTPMLKSEKSSIKSFKHNHRRNLQSM